MALPEDSERLRQLRGRPSAAAVEAQYSKIASTYDEYTRNRGWCAPEVLLDKLFTVAGGPKSRDRVLDIGVGTGQLSEPFLKAGAQVTGLDLSQAMLDQAKAQNPDYHSLKQHDLNDPLSSIPEQRFELVISSGTMHFARDLAACTREMNRVLGPGGVIAFTYIAPQQRRFGDSTYLYEPAEVRAMLEAQGLTVLAEDSFVAYEEKAGDPVRYSLVVAKKPGEPFIQETLADIDRTGCVDRWRVAAVSQTQLFGLPPTLELTADRPAVAAASARLQEDLEAQVRKGIIEPGELTWPTRTYADARIAPSHDALFVFGHPDDEAGYAAGTAGAIARQGHRTSLAVINDGAGGRRLDDGTPLAEVRAHELAASAKVLGISTLLQLGFEDFGKYRDAARQQPVSAAESLERWGLGRTLESLVYAIRTTRPRVLLTFDMTRDPDFSLHGHHLATGVATAVAYHLAADPSAYPDQLERGLLPFAPERLVVLTPTFGPNQGAITVSGLASDKRRSLEAHVSQVYSCERLIEALAKVDTVTERWHVQQARTDSPVTGGVSGLLGLHPPPSPAPATLPPGHVADRRSPG